MKTVAGYDNLTLFDERGSIHSYRAQRASDGKPVILKTIVASNSDIEGLSDLKHEFDLLKSLDTSSVLKPLGLELNLSVPHLVLEDFEGSPLHLDHREDLQAFFPLARRLIEAVGNLHGGHVVHGNLHPNNILFNPGSGDICILNLGKSAKLPRHRQTPADTIPAMDFAYTSPEQTGRTNRLVDYRTDLYSLGAVFYYLLTGKPPFPSQDPLVLIHSHLAQQVLPPQEHNPNIPPVLGELILKLLAKAPEERYQGTYGIRVDLEDCFEQWRQQGFVRPFALGVRDVPTRFLVPDHIFGRENEVAQLKEVLKSVGPGKSGLYLISGDGGMGKSRLLSEICEPLISNHFLTFRESFTEAQRELPLTALERGINHLIRQILKEPDDVVSQWRERFARQMGNIDHNFTKNLLGLDLILDMNHGNCHSCETPRETLYKILSIFCSGEKPLMIVLDDLQWADHVSLAVISDLLHDAEIDNFIIVASYRTSPKPESALRRFLETSHQERKLLGHIQLGPLRLDVVKRLLKDTLKASANRVGKLAAIVHEKTLGNPFFIHEFLKALHARGLIELHYPTGSWKWDLERIKRSGMPAGVASLMTRRIRELSEPIRTVLEHAACIGMDFDFEKLSRVLPWTRSSLILALEEAIERGLIFPQGESHKYMNLGNVKSLSDRDISFRFAHQKLSRAAIDLLEEPKRRQAHLIIGWDLLAENGGKDPKDLFTILRHLNQGSSATRDQERKLEIAKLNYRGAQLAEEISAFQTVKDCLQKGLDLMGPNGWMEHYQLNFEMHMLLVRAEIALRQLNQASHRFAKLKDQTRCEPDQIRVLLLGVNLHFALGQDDTSLKLGIQALEKQGLKLRTPTSKSGFWLDWTAFRVKQRLAPQEILDLPLMTDPKQLLYAESLVETSMASFHPDPILWAKLSLMALVQALKFGLSKYTSIALIQYAGFLGLFLGRWKQALEWGQIALRLASRFRYNHAKAHVLFIMGLMSQRGKDYSQNRNLITQAVHLATESGSPRLGDRATISLVISHFLAGLPANILVNTISRYWDNKHDSANLFALQTLLDEWHAQLQNGATDSGFFKETRPLALASVEPSLRVLFQLMRQQTGFLLGRDMELFQLQEKWNLGWKQRHPVSMLVPEHEFYQGLSLLHNQNQDKQHLKKLKRTITSLERLMVLNKNHFQSRYSLLLANWHDHHGEHHLAVEHFDNALRHSIEEGQVFLESLTRHLYGRHFFKRGLFETARSFLLDARQGYTQWGAKAIVSVINGELDQLQTRVPVKLIIKEETNFQAPKTSDSLDLKAIVMASQTISGEMDLPRLLEEIMRLLLEYAGARRGFLILPGEFGPTIEAEGDIQRLHITVRQSQPIAETNRLSRSLVQFVARTRETVVLDHAAQVGMFVNDPYIKKHQSKSLLCMPTQHKGRLTGIIYLENEMITAAFSKERCELIQVLAAQIAFSLENARLYEDLEEHSRTLTRKVEEKTRELSKTNLELMRKYEDLERMKHHLILQEKMASVGTIASGIASEIKNPLSFINNFAELSHEQARELGQLMAKYQEVYQQKDSENAMELLDLMRENMSLIDLNCKRVGDIVNSMLPFSFKSTDSKEWLPLEEILQWHGDVAYRGWITRGVSRDVTFEKHFDHELGSLMVTPDNLGRAIVNLLDNAFDAAAEHQAIKGGVPTVKLSARGDADQVAIHIYDNGPGITEAVGEQMFSPFFTTRANGRGIGLAIAYDIICNEHNGSLDFTTKEGHFTEFVAKIPRKPEGFTLAP